MGDKNRVLQERLRRVLPDACLVETPLPLTPRLKLWLLDADFHHHPYSAEESSTIMESPPYWSFCWASGQVLAHYLLQQPDLVTGKTVLDFGSGSGIAAVAAGVAGAKKVIACDIDADARIACAANAALNRVDIEVVSGLDEVADKVDLLLAADVLYDLENYPLLIRFTAIADQVIVADSRAKEVAPERYFQIDEMEATTLPDYGEFDEFKQVKIYRSRPDSGSAPTS